MSDNRTNIFYREWLCSDCGEKRNSMYYHDCPANYEAQEESRSARLSMARNGRCDIAGCFVCEQERAR